MPFRRRPKPARRAGAAGGHQRAIKGHVLLDERTQRRLRRIRWRRIGMLLALVAVLAGAVAVYLSPLLRVQEVEVVGTSAVDPTQVAQLAGLQGDSMLSLATDAAAERIEAIVLVKSARVVRHWPQAVRIEVTERRPWGTWRIGNSSYVIDAEGVVLHGLQPPDGAPVIYDMGGAVQLLPGDRVDVDAVALAQAMLQRVPEALGLGIVRLEYTPQAGLSLTTDGGYRVVLGDSQNVEYKLAAWRAVEEELGSEAMTGHVLDLRFQDRPSFQ